MLQAIVVKNIYPSQVRGSRVKAKCQAGFVTVDRDHHFSDEENHRRACEKLLRKLDWRGHYHGAWLPDGSSVWVCQRPGCEPAHTGRTTD